MSAGVRSGRGGDFASARRGGLSPLELEFINEKRGLGVSDFTIANMIGRPAATVQSIPRACLAVEPPPPPRKTYVIPLPVPPRKPTVSAPKIRKKGRYVARAMPARVKEIVQEVADKHGFTVEDLTGDSRKRKVAHARQEAWARIYEFKRPCGRNSYSMPLIGSWFGGRDHTTVLYGINAHNGRVAEVMREAA